MATSNNGMNEDKIIGNSYNKGEQSYTDFGNTIKVHDSVLGMYEDQLGENIVEHRTLQMLDDAFYEIFIISPYYEKYKKPKRADGMDRVKMYYYFKDKLLLQRKYSLYDIFTTFAEFFQVNYDQLWAEIGVLDKEGLLKELNEKRGIAHRIKTKRLF